MKKQRPTHINIILRPKAQDIAIEGVYNADGSPSSDGKFSVDDAAGVLWLEQTADQAHL